MHKIAETILLTGAGFTCNFGGFLAERMWAEIFNHPEIQRTEIRKIMLRDFNYESVYDRILYGSNECTFSERDKDDIKKAVFEAYKKLDNSITHFHKSGRFNSNSLMDLFRNLTGDKDTISYLFTLNQDIFVERYYCGEKPLKLPGPDIHEVPKRAISDKWEYALKDEDFITLKKDVNTLSIQSSLSEKEFNYIKLHGSYNWLSSDGSNAMVIGLNKESHISKEPLLTCYFEIFKKVLSRPNIKLLVIGYSFRDKHVNKLIKEAIENNGVKLFVLSSESPKNFVNKFLVKDEEYGFSLLSDEYPFGGQILGALTGYYPFKLNEESLKAINENLFMNK